MGNIASTGHWDLSKPQPQWKPKPKTTTPPKKSIWLPRQNSGSDSNDDWYIFKTPRTAAHSPHRAPRRALSPKRRR